MTSFTDHHFQVSFAILLLGKVEWGMKPLDAIRAATINAADLLGQAGTVGVLDKSYYADIVAVRRDPLEDITILEDVSFIMKGGRVYRNDIAK